MSTFLLFQTFQSKSLSLLVFGTHNFEKMTCFAIVDRTYRMSLH